MSEVNLELIAKLIREQTKKIDDLDFKVSTEFAQVQQDTRELRTAINDMARSRVTVGEIEALHRDVNRMSADISTQRVKLRDVDHRLAIVEGDHPTN